MKVEAPEVKVLIAAKAMERLHHWVGLASAEISGLGLVERQGEVYWVSDVFLPFQTNGGANTDIEPEAVARLMMELEEQGFDSSRLKFWWHSHADMAVFWSATDVETIGRFRPEDFFVSLVINKRHEHKTRVDYYSPIMVSFLEVAAEIKLPDLGQFEDCERLFEERVRENRGWHYRGGSAFLPEMNREELINLVSIGRMSGLEAEEILAEQEEAQRQYLLGWCDEG